MIAIPSGGAPDTVELELAKIRFAEAVAHWRLEPAETAALLGMPAPPEGADPLRGLLDEDAETRMRLLVEVARALDRIFPEPTLLEWLRDDEDDAETPLAFMSRGQVQLRAMRAAAAARGAA